MDLGLLLFLTAVGFLGLGMFWFHVARPMLEDFGLVKPYGEEEAPKEQRPAPPIMSNTPVSRVVSPDMIPVLPEAKQPASPANLTEVEIARWLAKRKTADTLSANDIYKLVGGNRNEVLQAVREARPRQVADEYITPFAGRVTDKKYYPDNPDLEYAPPSS